VQYSTNETAEEAAQKAFDAHHCEEHPMKHSYAVLRCKTCLSREITTWLLLKYLGPQNGSTIYTLEFPKLPKLVVFTMPCTKCGSTDTYSRNDVTALVADDPPPADFVDQMPLASVKSIDVA
jgi:hypothetical protein